MSLAEAGAKLNYRFLDAVRHRGAFTAAAEPAAGSGFDTLAEQHYALLVTFKRSGEGVPSPVLFALRDGNVLFRTDAGVGKVKRMRNNPRVLVGPCNFRGKPLGPMAEGTARFIEEKDAEEARLAIRSNYTRPMAIFESGADRMPISLAYVEVTPAEEHGVTPA